MNLSKFGETTSSEPEQNFNWLRWIKVLLVFKLVSALIITFGEFSHPHIIRQLDTMGVALRYWMRWTLEPSAPHALLPAVLTAGDTSGITPMEFPIMNLFYAPFFALPIEYARSAAWFTHVLISFALSFWHYSLWKGKIVFGIEAGFAALLVPLVGISTVFVGRFMPDYIAFLLVSSAIAMSWDKQKPALSFALSLLGLLMKPPAILAFALYFVATRKHLRSLLWVVPAVVIAFAYYKIGNGYIKSVSDYPAYFLTDLRNPLTSLIDFFTHPADFAKLLYKNLAAPAFLMIVLVGLTFWKTKNRSFYWLFAILALQLLGGAALDGDHAYIHFYYFMGSSFTVALLYAGLVKQTDQKWQNTVAALCIFALQIEMFVYEVKPITKIMNGTSIYTQCKSLKEKTPQFPWGKGSAFRSTQSQYPDLGLCFGEVQNSTRSRFGFFEKSESIPAECNQVEVSNDLVLTTCGT